MCRMSQWSVVTGPVSLSREFAGTSVKPEPQKISTSPRAREERSNAMVSQLASHRVFSAVPQAGLDELAASVIERHYEKGHYFFRAGDAASHVFAIVSGLASLVEDDRSGRDHPLYTLSAGDVFGLAAAILGIPRTLSARALTDARVLLVERDAFERLQRRFPDFGHQITLEVCRRLCLAEASAGQFALHNATSRIAKQLLDTQEYSSSHQELALRVGCSRETITRILGRLERSGVISMSRRQIKVLDRAKLLTLADPASPMRTR